MSRDPWTVLVEASPRTPIDEAGLARARGQVDAWRRSSATPAGSRRHQARPARRVLAVAGLSVAAAVVAVILPLGNPASTDSPTSILGVLPAAAVGLGCTNESDPVPGLSDPDQVVPRQQWATLSPVRQIMFLVGDGTPELASATSGPAVCDAIPVAVLTDEAGQGGIVVYRDVTEPFRGATHLAEVTVRGYPAKVLSPA
ncbi:MAG: hypothetical protein HGA44_20385, partial [Cellulomonadaceae bacterium]|nr:hypothetical protein [Cellulomonadaceae bacterium]